MSYSLCSLHPQEERLWKPTDMKISIWTTVWWNLNLPILFQSQYISCDCNDEQTTPNETTHHGIVLCIVRYHKDDDPLTIRMSPAPAAAPPLDLCFCFGIVFRLARAVCLDDAVLRWVYIVVQQVVMLAATRTGDTDIVPLCRMSLWCTCQRFRW